MTNVDANMMKCRFKMELTQAGYNLRNRLSSTNVLDHFELQNCLNLFNDHIKLLESKYACEFVKDGATHSLKAMKARWALNKIRWGAGGIGGIGGWFGGGALATVPIKAMALLGSKKATEVSLASFIAEATGFLSVPQVTITISGLGAIVGFLTCSKLAKKPTRYMIINNVMSQYENKVVPQLLDWFDKEIAH